ncbi:MAG: TonB family protein [Acidobacteria bacterium]|nr:TonB family protein [Acidobacteriota bacterium]
MSAVGMFQDLPATFPERDQYKKRSIISSAVVHTVLVGLLILIPLVAPQSIGQNDLLIALVMTLPPPPPPPPPAPEVPPQVQPQVEIIKTIVPEGMVAPTEIPREIARIIDDAPAPTAPGVVGGTGTGRVGGIIGGILARNAALEAAAAPPPPPPPPVVAAPIKPVRVGGAIQEPRIVKLVQPVYPALAARARVTGMVVLEAVVTDAGTVDEIKVISGHPLLVEAAIACVRQWLYEPTLLNGVPVPVILTAKVSFNFKTTF